MIFILWQTSVKVSIKENGRRQRKRNANSNAIGAINVSDSYK